MKRFTVPRTAHCDGGALSQGRKIMDRGSNGGASGNSNPSGSGDAAILARRYGWENAMGIASRVTCWDFME
jgi:hypothetical protein